MNPALPQQTLILAQSTKSHNKALQSQKNLDRLDKSYGIDGFIRHKVRLSKENAGRSIPLIFSVLLHTALVYDRTADALVCIGSLIYQIFHSHM